MFHQFYQANTTPNGARPLTSTKLHAEPTFFIEGPETWVEGPETWVFFYLLFENRQMG